jgi:predicted nucleic acid-binding protein
MFQELALAGKADALVSGDKDLLSLDGKLACPILGADEFFRRYDIAQ